MDTTQDESAYAARTMLARFLDEQGWSEATLWHLVTEWLSVEPGRVTSLSRFLNDVADTEREAALDLETPDLNADFPLE
jgi:hypothetical protein